MRPDLTWRRHVYLKHPYIVVKEPVGLKYYRFQEEEFAILEMLDGYVSLESIKEQFEQEFAPQKIGLQDLQNFIGMLHRSGLVIANASGQGKQLAKRCGEAKRKKILGSLTNILAIRFRGIDPDRILTWLYRYTSWLFSSITISLCWMLALSALLLVAVQFDTFRTRLPGFHEFFGPDNWIYLGVTLGLVKIIHEFGHGLSCKHYGGECHEMGFMMLVLTPCLYCNVSDSWMLPNKWHRAAIGFAGIYVEVMLASLATFIWWFTEPGLLNHVCLSVMFICSVSTIMFNGNPLLRFDGYYILADVLEIPNLRQKATQVLKRYLSEYCLGIEQQDDPFLPKRNQILFAFYTLAAVAYRWLVMFGILMFLNKVLEPIGLQIIGRAIALMAIVGLVIQPSIAVYKFFHIPGRMHQVKKPRLFASLGVFTAVVLAIAYVPLPHYVNCAFEIAPRDAVAVYADVPARLDKVLVKAGQSVQAGESVLFELSSIDLQNAVITLEGQIAEYEAQINNLRKQRFLNPEVSRQIPEIEKSLTMSRQQLVEKRRELARLTVKAPISGFVLPGAPRPTRDQSGQLPMWSGALLDRKNIGATLAGNDLLCRVGFPDRLEAILIVEQGDIEIVREQQKVYAKLDTYPGRKFETTITDISASEMKISPASLSNQSGGDIATETDKKTGMLRPAETSYQAKASIDDKEGLLTIGMRGNAKVYTGWQPLGRSLWRYVARTFNFDI